MTLPQILVFGLLAIMVGWLAPPRWKLPALLVISVAAVYALQPSTPVRNLDFWLPTAAIGLAAFTWAVTRPAAEAGSAASWQNAGLAAALVLGAILAVGLTRYLGPLCCLTPSRPPDLLRVALALGIGSVAAAVPARLPGRRAIILPPATALLIGLFIILKTPALAAAASSLLRQAGGQSTALASPSDLPWLGFSYLAFRLLHALRERQAGKLPDYGLGEFIVYALFFPAYTAGPIDRIQRFSGDLAKVTENGRSSRRDPADLAAGLERIVRGVFKKFVVADSLALIALNGQNAAQVQGAGWAWVLLYAYTLRIYFDFSGYTDVALGLGRLMGFRLPENFDRPYLKTNLTAFWNSWHITLAQWFRAYFFNPFTRFLRSRPSRPPVWMVILAGQLGTMLLIGLWHGVTANFVLWGAWHGLGLFVHNRWSGWLRPRLAGLEEHPRLRAALQGAGWLATFHYVALGWVWFALPTPADALFLLGKLF